MSFAAENVSFAGVVIAALFAAYGVVRYRSGGSRLDLVLSLLIALGVVLVSVVPQIFGIFTRLLGLEDRGFALLSIAVLLLFGLSLNLLGRVRESGRRSGEIVTGLAVRAYSERYLSSEERAEGHPGEVLIIVPAYDEEGGIQEVLRRIPDEVLGHEVKTVVVDDGSADRTADIAREEGVPVVTHVVNRGQGDALRTGFAIARAEKAEVVVNLDADGQYKPEELDRLVKPILEGNADFVLGSRFHGLLPGGRERPPRWGGVLLAFDLAAHRREGLGLHERLPRHQGLGAPQAQPARGPLQRQRDHSRSPQNKLRFEQVPVSMLTRAAGETKKPPKLAYPLGVFRVIISTWLR